MALIFNTVWIWIFGANKATTFLRFQTLGVTNIITTPLFLTQFGFLFLEGIK
jgi:hypothetical protein